MKVRLAFYKASVKNWTDVIIAGWTWIWNPTTKAYSHVEIGFEIEGKWQYFSSASRNPDGSNGTRWRDADDLFKYPERWDVYEKEFSLGETELMIARANTILGKKYDWLGIMGFATLFGHLNFKNKWYCSESCWYVLTGQWLKRISPRRMSARIREIGFLLT